MVPFTITLSLGILFKLYLTIKRISLLERDRDRIWIKVKSSMHHRSSQFGHLHGFFTARGPKWRPPVNSATQQSRKVSPLVFVRPLSVARRPWSPVTRERASIVTGIMNGPSLFSLIRASRRPCHASRASFVEKNNIQPPLPLVSAPFQLPLLSSTPLSPSV